MRPAASKDDINIIDNQSVIVCAYMPGSSRWTLPQHQVRDGALRLVPPLQRRRVVQSEVTVGEQQRIKEHGHGIGRSALQPLAQILQILETEREAERRHQDFLWADEASLTVHVLVWVSYLLQQRQVRLLSQLAVQQGVRVRRPRWQVGGVTWQQVWQTDAWGAVTWGNTERERERERGGWILLKCQVVVAERCDWLVAAVWFAYRLVATATAAAIRRSVCCFAGRKQAVKTTIVTEELRYKSQRAAAAWLGKFDCFISTCTTSQTDDISTLSRGQRQSGSRWLDNFTISAF